MASPNVIALPAGEWTKVATNVTHGVIDRLSGASPAIQATYRMNREAAPEDLADASLMDGDQIIIQAPAGIDVYLYASGETAGSVKVSV